MTDAKTQARQILELLRLRHAPPEWAGFAGLADGTGARSYRWIDFYAINCWPSKRFLKAAYEVKVSRSDFARELADPKKREPAEKLADECYFAVPVGLIKPDEVPEGWGLIELVANGLRVKKRAQQRKVESLPLTFVASIARRVAEKPDLPAVVWLKAGEEIGEDELRAAAVDEQGRWKELIRYETIKNFKNGDRYRNLEDVSGVIRQLIGWQYAEDPQRLAEYLRGNDRPLSVPTNLKDSLTRSHRILGQLIQEMEGEKG